MSDRERASERVRESHHERRRSADTTPGHVSERAKKGKRASSRRGIREVVENVEEVEERTREVERIPSGLFLYAEERRS